jgi:hypothetical protein
MTPISILIISVFILSILCFLIVSNIKIRTKNKYLSDDNSKLQKKVDDFKNYIPGRKGIIYNFPLQQTSTKTDFKVTYEVEIIEVSENKIKVSAYDFTSTDSFARDPTNKQNIIGFFQNQWVPKKDVELLIDKTDIRDSKIEQILL